MLKHYVAMSRSKDGLKRDETTFNDFIWPAISQLRMKDKEIGAMQRVIFGKAVNVWSLK